MNKIDFENLYEMVNIENNSKTNIKMLRQKYFILFISCSVGALFILFLMTAASNPLLIFISGILFIGLTLAGLAFFSNLFFVK